MTVTDRMRMPVNGYSSRWTKTLSLKTSAIWKTQRDPGPPLAQPETFCLPVSCPTNSLPRWGRFGNELIKVLIPMGLRFALQTYSGATIKDDENWKQGDNGWAPNRPPPGHDRKWPTVVLEVAVSESQSKLQSDVRFWLREGQEKVKLVFTLAVDRNSPKITIDKWEPEGHREVCTQHVTVYQGAHKHLLSPLNSPNYSFAIRTSQEKKTSNLARMT